MFTVGLGLLANSHQFLPHLIAHFNGRNRQFIAQTIQLSLKSLKGSLAIGLVFLLDLRQPVFRRGLDHGQLGPADLFAFSHNERVAQQDIFGGGAAFHVFQTILDDLGFMNSLIGRGCQLLIISLIESRQLRFQFGDTLLGAFGFFIDSGLNLFFQAQFGFGQLFLQPLYGALAGFFVHVSDDILGKIEDAVQVAAGNVEE